MKIIKGVLRLNKRLLVRLFGSRTDELYWKSRHIFDKSWPKSYISKESLNHPHRTLLIDHIANYFPFESILEIGCASGPNLYLIAKRLPETKIYGIDISRKAIQEGKEYFKKQNIKNVLLDSGGINNLRKIKSKSIDVIFTDAAGIYIGVDKIKSLIEEMVRIARKNIVLFEMHHDSPISTYLDNWVHNYRLLFGGFVSDDKIKITKIPRDLWAGNWDEYGYIIEVFL